MSNVISINGGKPDPNAPPSDNPERMPEWQTDMIKMLENLVEEAKAGRITDIAAVFMNGHESPGDMYVGGGDGTSIAAIIGGLELCKHTLLLGQHRENIAG